MRQQMQNFRAEDDYLDEEYYTDEDSAHEKEPVPQKKQPVTISEEQRIKNQIKNIEEEAKKHLKVAVSAPTSSPLKEKVSKPVVVAKLPAMSNNEFEKWFNKPEEPELHPYCSVFSDPQEEQPQSEASSPDHGEDNEGSVCDQPQGTAK